MIKNAILGCIMLVALLTTARAQDYLTDDAGGRLCEDATCTNFLLTQAATEPEPPKPPTCQLSVAPTSVLAGGVSSVTWSSVNAAKLDLTAANDAGTALFLGVFEPPGGSRQYAFHVNTNLTVIATSADGLKAECKARVTILPPPPVTACMMQVPTCPLHPETPTTRFKDDFEGASSNQSRCMARPQEFVTWCATKDLVIADYESDGKIIQTASAQAPPPQPEPVVPKVAVVTPTNGAVLKGQGNVTIRVEGSPAGTIVIRAAGKQIASCLQAVLCETKWSLKGIPNGQYSIEATLAVLNAQPVTNSVMVSRR